MFPKNRFKQFFEFQIFLIKFFENIYLSDK
jgi:hypothetical protein